MARRRRVVSPPWSDVYGLLHMKLTDAAEVLGISSTHLKFLCRRNGLPRWPGKTIRSLNAKLDKLTMEAARHGPLPMPGAANRRRRPLEKIKQEAREVLQKLLRVHAQIKNPDPAEQSGDGTVNLLDNVGVSRRRRRGPNRN